MLISGETTIFCHTSGVDVGISCGVDSVDFSEVARIFIPASHLPSQGFARNSTFPNASFGASCICGA